VLAATDLGSWLALPGAAQARSDPVLGLGRANVRSTRLGIEHLLALR
jgi:hypothetical protein